MAISVTTVGSVLGSTGTTTALTVPAGGVPSGALIVAAVQDRSTVSSGGSVADSSSNTWAAIVALDCAGTSNGFGCVYYTYNATALSSGNTITHTKVTSGEKVALSVLYATGIDTSAPLDTAVTASASGTGTPFSVTSGTPSQSGELFLGVLSEKSSQTWTNTSPWTTPFDFIATSGNGVGGANQVNSGTGTKTFSETITGTPNWAAFIVGFKAPAAAGGFQAAWARGSNQIIMPGRL